MDNSSLENRVTRLERLSANPNWLDEPAEIDGEPFVMGDSYPFFVWIVIGLFCLLAALTIGSLLYYDITGNQLL